MAILTLNPLINKISGRMGNVVFYKRRDKQCARIYVIPCNPDTEAQKAVRGTFAKAVESWQSLTQDEKFNYARKARHLQMSGYNYYISIYMKNNISHKTESSNNNILTTQPFHSVSYSNESRYSEVCLIKCNYYASG